MSQHRRIRHVVLTRFNVRYAGDPNPRVLRADWLEERFALFEQWCLPSVAGQTQTGGTRPWLILVDSETPKVWLDRLARYRSNTDLRAVPLRGGWSDAQLRAVVAAVADDSPQLLTSRVDSDDAIACGYLDAVLAAAENATGTTYISAPSGLRLQGDRLYRYRDRHGPFMSMVEPMADARTVLVVPHHRLSRIASGVRLADGPWWIQVVHGGNLANAVEGMPVRRADAIRSRFTVPLPSDPVDDTRLDAILATTAAAIRTGLGVTRRAIGRARGQ